jgi:hypothetical protein
MQKNGEFHIPPNPNELRNFFPNVVEVAESEFFMQAFERLAVERGIDWRKDPEASLQLQGWLKEMLQDVENYGNLIEQQRKYVDEALTANLRKLMYHKAFVARRGVNEKYLIDVSGVVEPRVRRRGRPRSTTTKTKFKKVQKYIFTMMPGLLAVKEETTGLYSDYNDYCDKAWGRNNILAQRHLKVNPGLSDADLGQLLQKDAETIARAVNAGRLRLGTNTGTNTGMPTPDRVLAEIRFGEAHMGERPVMIQYPREVTRTNKMGDRYTNTILTPNPMYHNADAKIVDEQWRAGGAGGGRFQDMRAGLSMANPNEKRTFFSNLDHMMRDKNFWGDLTGGNASPNGRETLYWHRVANQSQYTHDNGYFLGYHETNDIDPVTRTRTLTQRVSGSADPNELGTIGPWVVAYSGTYLKADKMRLLRTTSQYVPPMCGLGGRHAGINDTLITGFAVEQFVRPLKVKRSRSSCRVVTVCPVIAVNTVSFTRWGVNIKKTNGIFVWRSGALSTLRNKGFVPAALCTQTDVERLGNPADEWTICVDIRLTRALIEQGHKDLEPLLQGCKE